MAAPPWAFQAEGKWHLVYELRLTNFVKKTATVTAVDVLAVDHPQKALARFTAADLAGMTIRRGAAPGEDVLSIPAGATAFIYLWVTVDRRTDVPSALVHRLSVRTGEAASTETFLTPSVPVDRTDPPVIDPPLRGGRWGAYNAPSNSSIHRRGFAPVDGRVSIGERFATDWARVEPNGEVYKGDATLNASYPGYGAKVYAVADGVVTQARDGAPDNQPGKSPSSYATADDLAGNHIIQRIGPRQFALYAHLQMGSLRVRPGGKVRRGQVIGLLGNSGNSTGPHLHFHICDADSAMGCEGVPFVFRSFVTEGHNLWTGPTTEREVARHLELPLADTIVRFGP